MSLTKKEGFEKLWDAAQVYQSKWNLGSICFGIESTGNRSQTPGSYMEDKETLVVQVNGSHTKRLKVVLDNSPLKVTSRIPKS